jgi:hypothetical protein
LIFVFRQVARKLYHPQSTHGLVSTIDVSHAATEERRGWPAGVKKVL